MTILLGSHAVCTSSDAAVLLLATAVHIPCSSAVPPAAGEGGCEVQVGDRDSPCAGLLQTLLDFAAVSMRNACCASRHHACAASKRIPHYHSHTRCDMRLISLCVLTAFCACSPAVPSEPASAGSSASDLTAAGAAGGSALRPAAVSKPGEPLPCLAVSTTEVSYFSAALTRDS
jgi:hypothetical protein